MQYIYTTDTTIETVKLVAKKFKKENDIKWCKALDKVSVAMGYKDYNHLIICKKITDKASK